MVLFCTVQYLTENIYWVSLVVLQFSIANRDKTRTKSGLTTWVKKIDNTQLKTIQEASLPYDKCRYQMKKKRKKIKQRKQTNKLIKDIYWVTLIVQEIVTAIINACTCSLSYHFHFSASRPLTNNAAFSLLWDETEVHFLKIKET